MLFYCRNTLVVLILLMGITEALAHQSTIRKRSPQNPPGGIRHRDSRGPADSHASHASSPSNAGVSVSSGNSQFRTTLGSLLQSPNERIESVEPDKDNNSITIKIVHGPVNAYQSPSNAGASVSSGDRELTQDKDSLLHYIFNNIPNARIRITKEDNRSTTLKIFPGPKKNSFLGRMLPW